MFAKAVVLAGVLLGFANVARCEPPFNNPPGVDVWCGKAYRETDSSFDPGGWLEPPSSNGTLGLMLNVVPRYNFYLDMELEGSFVVDTRAVGSGSSGYLDGYNGSSTNLLLTVWNANVTLLSNVSVSVNASGIEVPFDLNLARTGGESFQVEGRSSHGGQTYISTVSITWLPERDDGGSMARLDRLNGGIHISSSMTSGNWKSIFPVGFYTRWDWISWLIDPENNPEPDNLASNETKSLQEFKEQGYNLVHPVPPGGWESFNDTVFEKFLTICDELELYVMYDMRHTYLNLSSISTQLPRLQSHPSLLLYYTGDEPDGWTDPLNGTILAYNRIREIDPYHPVSLVLNCYNFYFEEYTSGADIILEDTYPLIKSSTFSTVYNTVCNQTYGDCGCDFCHVNNTAYPEFEGLPFKDVVDRTDNFYQFQRWIGQKETKPVWGVPQWFYDADSFWSRWATKEEAVVMALLRVNHGAMGVVGWIFPTSPEIQAATTEMAGVLTSEDVTRLLTEGTGKHLTPSYGADDIDAAAWVWEDEILVIAIWPKYTSGGRVCIPLPTEGKDVSDIEVLLGVAWSADGGTLCREEIQPLEVSVLRAKIGGY
ncbi:hypothetical protein BU23DRAFT_540385 [Bimuria novae-zelandiae CBS 107.79]|uniref:Glycoside hydrolase n=1 Tax=Bimuria novae-zelandiae CBS 107.79 TaxID=1447943 RepID=A0A6A5V1B2_9PLEO|nr:hypothetical protein BU23DRAFT_540385 [Bimuria novae-zelandiae CBS 107.79]